MVMMMMWWMKIFFCMGHEIFLGRGMIDDDDDGEDHCCVGVLCFVSDDH